MIGFTPTTKGRASDRQSDEFGCWCANCGRPVYRTDKAAIPKVPRNLGGKATTDNCIIVHSGCIQTTRDTGVIPERDRIQTGPRNSLALRVSFGDTEAQRQTPFRRRAPRPGRQFGVIVTQPIPGQVTASSSLAQGQKMSAPRLKRFGTLLCQGYIMIGLDPERRTLVAQRCQAFRTEANRTSSVSR
jgi:hypothetical protein